MICVCVYVCSGLDESVAQYVPLFHVNGVDGRKLLMLNHADLEKIGINKLGHQELVLEAVDLLRSLVGALGALSAVSELLVKRSVTRKLFLFLFNKVTKKADNKSNTDIVSHITALPPDNVFSWWMIWSFIFLLWTQPTILKLG